MICIVYDLIIWQLYTWNIMIATFIFSFFIRVLAELNQSPIDLVEDKSGLVPGFNIGYFGIGFALIFIAEYGTIILFRFVILMIFRKYSWSFMMGLCIFRKWFSSIGKVNLAAENKKALSIDEQMRGSVLRSMLRLKDAII